MRPSERTRPDQDLDPDPDPAPALSAVPVAQIHPAVADLLVHRGEPSPSLARTATLAMARAGGALSVEDRDGIQTVCLREEPNHEPPLRPFEELMLQRVRQRMGEAMDHVPLAALGPGDGSPYTRWRLEMRKALLEEAVAQRLIRASRRDLNWRTPAGIRAALWWRRRIPRAQRFIKSDRRLEARTGWPRHQSHDIWSSTGGTWHLVPTAPLENPSWGATWNLVLLALALAGALTMDLASASPHRPIIAATLTLLAMAIAGAWLPAGRARHRIPRDATFRGTIICRFDSDFWNEESGEITTSYHCSIEDPTTEQAWTFEYATTSRLLYAAKPQPYASFDVGDTVDVHCDPRARTLHSIERVEVN